MSAQSRPGGGSGMHTSGYAGSQFPGDGGGGGGGDEQPVQASPPNSLFEQNWKSVSAWPEAIRAALAFVPLQWTTAKVLLQGAFHPRFWRKRVNARLVEITLCIWPRRSRSPVTR